MTSSPLFAITSFSAMPRKSLISMKVQRPCPCLQSCSHPPKSIDKSLILEALWRPYLQSCRHRWARQFSCGGDCAYVALHGCAIRTAGVPCDIASSSAGAPAASVSVRPPDFPGRMHPWQVRAAAIAFCAFFGTSDHCNSGAFDRGR